MEGRKELREGGNKGGKEGRLFKNFLGTFLTLR
jgi:hypothetical protein